MSDTKLCMNCKHYRARDFALNDLCAHSAAQNPLHVVRGDQPGAYASNMRLGGKCGLEAIYFEPKSENA